MASEFFHREDFSLLSIESPIPDPQSSIPDPESPIPNPQSRIPNPESCDRGINDRGCRIGDSGSGIGDSTDRRRNDFSLRVAGPVNRNPQSSIPVPASPIL